MKKISVMLAVIVGLLWSANWVNACENCGCKAKAAAATTDAKTTTVAPTTAVKCVACPNADATKPAGKCTGDCKAGCCKGDATKCATCPAAKTCSATAAAATTTTTAAATTTTTCGAAKTCGAAGKGCGYTLPTTETKATEPAK